MLAKRTIETMPENIKKSRSKILLIAPTEQNLLLCVNAPFSPSFRPKISASKSKIAMISGKNPIAFAVVSLSGKM